MYGAYKEKERVWKRESRMKAPSPRKAVAERRKCRERVRLHKLRKKLSTSQDANSTDLEFAYRVSLINLEWKTLLGLSGSRKQVYPHFSNSIGGKAH